MKYEQALEMLRRHKLVAILRGIPAEKSLRVAQALYDGGVRVLEFTFDHDLPDYQAVTCEQVRRVAEHFGDRLAVGCGTVLTEDEVVAGREAGAVLIVSPNANEKVIQMTRQLGMISMPGAFTPTEVVSAWEAGADIVKLFPAGALGAGYIRAIKAPLRHIPVSAVGGVRPENVAELLDCGVCGFGIGSEMVKPQDAIDDRMDTITDRARAFVDAIEAWEAKQA